MRVWLQSFTWPVSHSTVGEFPIKLGYTRTSILSTFLELFLLLVGIGQHALLIVFVCGFRKGFQSADAGCLRLAMALQRLR